MQYTKFSTELYRDVCYLSLTYCGLTILGMLSKIEKVPRGIGGEKSSKAGSEL